MIMLSINEAEAADPKLALLWISAIRGLSSDTPRYKGEEPPSWYTISVLRTALQEKGTC